MLWIFRRMWLLIVSIGLELQNNISIVFLRLRAISTNVLPRWTKRERKNFKTKFSLELLSVIWAQDSKNKSIRLLINGLMVKSTHLLTKSPLFFAILTLHFFMVFNPIFIFLRLKTENLILRI